MPYFYLPDKVWKALVRKWLREMEEEGVSLEVEETDHTPSKEEIEEVLKMYEGKEKSCGRG